MLNTNLTIKNENWIVDKWINDKWFCLLFSPQNNNTDYKKQNMSEFWLHFCMFVLHCR
jgi:hypothetical protein